MENANSRDVPWALFVSELIGSVIFNDKAALPGAAHAAFEAVKDSAVEDSVGTLSSRR
jgi:hypothetical protein